MKDVAEDKLPLLLKCVSILILENGGEIYRVEDSCSHICRGLGIDDFEFFALPTGIFFSFTDTKGISHTCIKRISKRGINFEMIDRANNISRRLESHTLTVDEALAEIEAIYINKSRNKGKSKLLNAVYAAFCVGCFSVLFRGNVYDFIFSAVCGFVISIIADSFSRTPMFHFMISVLGGGVCAAIASAGVLTFSAGSAETIIASAIMLLLPGLSLVNAIRDIVYGDLTSGVTRVGEVFVISFSVAAGAATVLSVIRLITGG